MGNETSLLKKCNISSKPRFTTTQWSLFDAEHESQSFSAFIFSNYDYCNDFTVSIYYSINIHLNNICCFLLLKNWKHVRHPYLVKFYEAGIYKNKKYILTEPVIPLRQILERFHRFSRLSGLYNIGEALEFLHQICHLSLNNLSIDSIFVSKNDPNELWKLGSLYWCNTIHSDDVNFYKNLIHFHEQNNTLQILPPENRDRNQPLLIQSLANIHRRDVYSFVLLIQELFYNPNVQPKLAEILSATDKSNHNFMAKALIDSFHRCNPDERPTVQAIINDPLFKNCPFVHLRQFLGNFSTYNDKEKFDFLQVLVQNLRQFPDQSLVVSIFTMIVSSRFILSNRIVYNHVMPYFLIPLRGNSNQSDQLERINSQSNEENRYILTNGETITLSPFIDEQSFRDGIIPHIIKLYCVHDYKIRMLLLKYLPHYGSCISKTCLKKILLPQILLGIKDSDKELVALTFRAVASLIDLFGVRDVLGGSNRIKYFTTGVAGDDENSNRSMVKLLDDNISERRNSYSSTKSSSLFDDDRKLDSVIFERSSPDGGETVVEISHSSLNGNDNDKSVANKFPSLITTIDSEYTNDDHDDEWPVWEPNEQPISTNNINNDDNKTTSKISKKIDSSIKLKENFKTFDIKEIDFNQVHHSKEIDNLFMDMAPVLNFNNHHRNSITTTSDMMNDGPNLQSIRIDASIFDDKNDLNVQDNENNGWNDSLDWNDLNDGSIIDADARQSDVVDE
ncbi:Protein kinase-like protein [Euroglyphus maynei]|uniref:Protein kinase-like protein n=1 Tax=Euroglyphus maynei TaxID=6958 RepID=A0A1Y3AX98_EURMA|nr:Protein kinase-like protein [Euroglyphus maynei]